MDLKFKAGLPMYMQLADYLRNKIADGTIAPGESVPSENYLSTELDISRVTVRKSLQILTDEGLVVKRQGKGTFVITSEIVESADAHGSFTVSCIQNGIVPTTKILQCEKIPCDAEIAKDLHIGVSDEIILIKRVRYADEVPVIFEADYIPAEKHGYLLDISLEDESLLSVMKNQGHAHFGGYNDLIDVRYAGNEHSTWLNVKKNAPLLGVYQKVFDMEDKLIYINDQLINTERYKYVSVHKK